MEPSSIIYGAVRGLQAAKEIFMKPKHQPKLFFILTWQGTFKPAGLPSRRNDPKRIYTADEIIRISQIEWTFKITIRNNSETHAYNLNLLKPEVNSRVIIEPALDDLKPLVANDEVSYEIKIRIRAEGKQEELEELMNDNPTQLKNERFVLEYTNSQDEKFYTIFKYKGKNKGVNHLFTTYDYNLIKGYL